MVVGRHYRGLGLLFGNQHCRLGHLGESTPLSMIPMRIFVYHFYLILIFLKFVLCLLISGKVVDIISKSFCSI